MSTAVTPAFAYLPTSPSCYGTELKDLLTQGRSDVPSPICGCKTCNAILLRYDELETWLHTSDFDKHLKYNYDMIWNSHKEIIKHEAKRNTAVSSFALSNIVLAALAIMSRPISKTMKGIVFVIGGISVYVGIKSEKDRVITVNGKKLTELEIELTMKLLETLSKIIDNKKWKDNNYLQITMNRDPIHPEIYAQFAYYQDLNKFYKNINVEKTMDSFNENLKKIFKAKT